MRRVEPLRWNDLQPQWGVVTTASKLKVTGGILIQIKPSTLELTVVEGFVAPIIPVEEQLLCLEMTNATSRVVREA